jgi:hypothetical protein
MTPRVFLCEPTGLMEAQRRVSDRWHESMFELGFDVEQLRRSDYQRDPWPKLLQSCGSADGVLVLGFRQLIIDTGTWRIGTEEEAQVAAAWTSPWLHVEVGMALANGVPVLVAAESGVSEGAFASVTWIGTLLGTSAEEPNSEVIDQWASAVVARACSISTVGDTGHGVRRRARSAPILPATSDHERASPVSRLSHNGR